MARVTADVSNEKALIHPDDVDNLADGLSSQRKREKKAKTPSPCAVCSWPTTGTKADQRLAVGTPGAENGVLPPLFLSDLCSTHHAEMDDWVTAIAMRANDAIGMGWTPPKTPDPTGQTVYFFQRRDRFIKIGVSYNVFHRKESLETGSGPLRLLGIEEGGVRRERELHRQFATSREHGEWFRPTDDLVDYIMALR